MYPNFDFDSGCVFPHFLASACWQFNNEMIQWDCGRFLDQLFDTDLKALNTNILICTFWRLLEAFTSMVGPYFFLVGGVFPLLAFICG